MDIERIANRALLKGAIQQSITCKISGAVLDMKTAVLLTITGPLGTKESAVYDGSVFDEKMSHVVALREKGFTIDIIDGRTL